MERVKGIIKVFIGKDPGRYGTSTLYEELKRVSPSDMLPTRGEYDSALNALIECEEVFYGGEGGLETKR